MAIRPTPQTAARKKRIDDERAKIAVAEASTDDLDLAFATLAIEHPAMVEHIDAAKALLRRELGGRKVYIRVNPPTDMRPHVLRLFDGRNAAEVARTLGVSRAFVYRCLRLR